MYIAHIRESDGKIQSVQEHLLQVSELAGQFGKKVGIENLARLAGLLHDLGKISENFSQYISDAHNNKKNPPKRGSVDHSTLGGKFLFDHYGKNTTNAIQHLTIEIVSNAIVSHHGYLQDYLSVDLASQFLKRIEKDAPEIKDGYDKIDEFLLNNLINKTELDEMVERAVNEVTQFVQKMRAISTPEKSESQLMFLTKLVFSTLIDADRTNTRQFEENDYSTQTIDTGQLFDKYYDKLIKKISSFEVNENSSEINKLRSQMSDQCDDYANNAPGIYTLSIPTGGGKTLASFRYALKHAVKFNKERILYILPYTTIIEQNAEEIRKIIDDPANLLEHHSNVIFEENNDEEITEDERGVKTKLQLVKDNWEVPIVFSTLVQFLDIFYASGTRSIRRLHNLSNSVIIFDEVQKVPTHCISLFNEALNFLKENLNCTILLCTATQPSLEGVTHGLDLSENHEIVKDLIYVATSFKRVEVKDKLAEGSIDTDSLARFVLERSEVVTSQLIIMNTKSVVRKLYEALRAADSTLNIFHLSTSMAPEHRKNILNKIKDNLKEKIPVICISTQLIEAGVDISFESVIRSLAGLDSIAQAAGRCNRHGERLMGEVFIIEHSEENTEKMKDVEAGKVITRKLLSSMRNNKDLYDGDLFSEAAMRYYFDSFYEERKGMLNHPNKGVPFSQIELIMSSRGNNKLIQEYMLKYSKTFPLVNSTSMGTAAKKFYVIENQTQTLIVPYGSGEDVIADLNSSLNIKELYMALKNIQQCSIQVYPHELERLKRENGVYAILEDEAYVLTPNYYSEELGLNFEGDSTFKFQSF